MEDRDGNRMEQDEENGRWWYLEGPNAGEYVTQRADDPEFLED